MFLRYHQGYLKSPMKGSRWCNPNPVVLRCLSASDRTPMTNCLELHNGIVPRAHPAGLGLGSPLLPNPARPLPPPPKQPSLYFGSMLLCFRVSPSASVRSPALGGPSDFSRISNSEPATCWGQGKPSPGGRTAGIHPELRNTGCKLQHTVEHSAAHSPWVVCTQGEAKANNCDILRQHQSKGTRSTRLLAATQTYFQRTVRWMGILCTIPCFTSPSLIGYR